MSHSKDAFELDKNLSTKYKELNALIDDKEPIFDIWQQYTQANTYKYDNNMLSLQSTSSNYLSFSAYNLPNTTGNDHEISFTPQIINNYQQKCVIDNSTNAYCANKNESRSIIYPVYSNKYFTGSKKIKNIKKKKFDQFQVNNITKNDDIEHIVVSIESIGLGPKFNNKSEMQLLIGKFRRLYFFLNALCRERRMLESIILSTEFKPSGKYILSPHNAINEHLDYTRQCIFIEIDLIERLLNSIQDKSNTSAIPFVQVCWNLLVDFRDYIRKLNAFQNTEIYRKFSINTEGVATLGGCVSKLIATIRYLCINYTLLSQKLLSKEVKGYEIRRRMFIGN